MWDSFFFLNHYICLNTKLNLSTSMQMKKIENTNKRKRYGWQIKQIYPNGVYLFKTQNMWCFFWTYVLFVCAVSQRCSILKYIKMNQNLVICVYVYIFRASETANLCIILYLNIWLSILDIKCFSDMCLLLFWSSFFFLVFVWAGNYTILGCCLLWSCFTAHFYLRIYFTSSYIL